MLGNTGRALNDPAAELVSQGLLISLNLLRHIVLQLAVREQGRLTCFLIPVDPDIDYAYFEFIDFFYPPSRANH